MAIVKKEVWITSDGTQHDDLFTAQCHEGHLKVREALESFLCDNADALVSVPRLAEVMVDNADKLMSLLSPFAVSENI